MVRSLVLRPITKNDLEWCRKIRNTNRKFFFDSNNVTVKQQEKWFTTLRTPFFIIEYGGRRVGTISIKKVSNTHEINNVLIDRQYRRQGIFKKVIELVIKKFGLPLSIEVKAKNKEAQEAYKKLGFIEYSLRMQKNEIT